MKQRVLAAGFCVYLSSCISEKEVQGYLVDVKLIKIDTIQRYPDFHTKRFTWIDIHNIHYITFEPMNVNYFLGTSIIVLLKK